MPALLAPPIHVRLAPNLDPPYDDEIAAVGVPPVPAPLGQPPLPLDWSSPARRPTESATRSDAAAPPVTTRSRHSPARGATMHFLSLCLEVLNGFRPTAHLRPLTAPAEFGGVVEQIARAMRRASSPHRRGAPTLRSDRLAGARPLPARPVGRPPRHGPPVRIRLRELRVCEPRPGVVEAAAVLGNDDRAFALALRLERRPAGWLCTLAQVV